MTADLLDELRALLSPVGLLTDAVDRARFEQGWRYGRGQALAVARPASTQQTAAVLALCRRHGVRVQPQGANTGLVAASNPDDSGRMLVLSLERLNRTIDVDAGNRTVLVDGGVLLSQLNEALKPHGLCFPVDLGADPQIGGMVATNTGGTRLLRYGDVRQNLLGAEVVFGDGTVLSALNRLRKNNTGLDSKQLFVGTTGVFGVVTRAVLQVTPLPRQRATALVGCPDGDTVLALLGALERELGDVLSAFEVMSRNALGPVFAHQPSLRNPFRRGDLPAYAVLVELASTLPESALALPVVLETTLGNVIESGAAAVDDVFVGAGDDFWNLRHHISESLRHEGRTLAFDISVARSALPAFTAAVAAMLSQSHPFLRLCDYGHWGDGGTHLNLVWRDEDAGRSYADIAAELQPRIYDLAVRDFGGSYSAEHGVGPHNQRFFDRYTDPAVKALGAMLKRHCDPGDLLGTTRLW